MIVFVLGLLLLSLITGVVIGLCYCGWLNKVREVRLVRNWPFVRVLRAGHSIVQTRDHRQGRQRNRNRNRCRNQQNLEIREEEQVVLAIE